MQKKENVCLGKIYRNCFLKDENIVSREIFRKWLSPIGLKVQMNEIWIFIYSRTCLCGISKGESFDPIYRSFSLELKHKYQKKLR